MYPRDEAATALLHETILEELDLPVLPLDALLRVLGVRDMTVGGAVLATHLRFYGA